MYLFFGCLIKVLHLIILKHKPIQAASAFALFLIVQYTGFFEWLLGFASRTESSVVDGSNPLAQIDVIGSFEDKARFFGRDLKVQIFGRVRVVLDIGLLEIHGLECCLCL